MNTLSESSHRDAVQQQLVVASWTGKNLALPCFNVSGTDPLLYLVKLSSERGAIKLRTRQLHSASQAVNTAHHEADVLALEQIHGLCWARGRRQESRDTEGLAGGQPIQIVPSSFPDAVRV